MKGSNLLLIILLLFVACNSNKESPKFTKIIIEGTFNNMSLLSKVGGDSLIVKKGDFITKNDFLKIYDIDSVITDSKLRKYEKVVILSDTIPAIGNYLLVEYKTDQLKNIAIIKQQWQRLSEDDKKIKIN